MFWKHLFSVLVDKTASTMIMETMIPEIQSEDEIIVNDRATADHVRGCRMPLDVHAPNHQLKNSKI